MKPASRDSAGFTLIEAILAITITGIIAGIVAVFIRSPIQGYVDSVRRAELTDAADVALRRLSRDVRLALPNSLRVKTIGASHYIEFIMTSGGGRYRDVADGSSSGDFLSFTSTSDTSFHVLGKTTNAATDGDYVGSGDYIVIYNLGEGYAPADAYNFDTTTETCRTGGCNMAKASTTTLVSCASSPCTITLTTNPFAAPTTPLPSPNSRFQVIPAAVKAVTYACPSATPGNLVRHWNYGLTTSQAAPSGGSNALLAKNATCEVEYTTNATGRNGLLYIKLTLTDSAGTGESVTIFNQVRIANAP